MHSIQYRLYRGALNAGRTSREKRVRLSVRPSVRLANAWIAIKRKKNLFRFLYHTKDHLTWFSEKNNGSCSDPTLQKCR